MQSYPSAKADIESSPAKGMLPAEPEAEALPAMDDPLAVVNALHQIILGTGLHADLSLPMIAVVGSQSVGKTSVLESLVGRDFLPRGSGIVTRRPLILQLRAVPSEPSGQGPMEWAEFEHRPGEKIVSFEKVRSEVTLETDYVCGEHGISDEPILLRIYSPSVMDLTLVDLPGLTKVPTGDQPKDISDRIRQLVLKYISSKNTIILAVSAANNDLATSDSLAIAREVDPQGDRTVGVLTKLDLADETGSAVEALKGMVYPLRHGYTGIVCRNESDTRAGVSFQQALQAEEAFITKSPTLQPLAAQCGIPNLARRLQTLLLEHIRESLPQLRASLQHVADQSREELASLGDQQVEQRMGQGPFLLHLISGYVRNFADVLEGRLAYRQQEHALPAKLVGGARLHYIFHRVFGQTILDFSAFSGLSDMEIRVAMRNAAGPKPQLFVPEIAFENLVKRQIQKLEDPALQCVSLVFDELKQLASQSDSSEIQRFPSLREKVLEVANRVIQRCLQPTNQMVSNLIRIEREYINVDHPDFIGGVRAMSFVQEAELELPPAAVPSDGQDGSSQLAAPRHEPPKAKSEDPLRLPAVPLIVTPCGEASEKERMDTELLKSLILSYFTIVKRKIIDSVPKTIMHFMVNAVRDKVHAECITELYKEDLFRSLLQEPDDLRQRRERCEQKLAELRKAQDVLSQICDAASQV
eukprot:TRINITY_DN92527_c0_g1_i1.p1 TRINITY_DN92527_c0_g1~~TRINITY_DN92527_c0_g1_i1.p1  ORF type:complete len:698 (+),score=124.09 TRINITY_DN92527_c0_g1_i1:59-2152(+)